MKPNDFIFNSVYRNAIKQGAKEPIAKDCAITAMRLYKTNQFKKAGDMIDKQIKEAVKQSKKV